MTLWEGRFREQTAQAAKRLCDSIGFDRRLLAAEVRANTAYARALERAGLLTPGELEQLIQGLEAVRSEMESGALAPGPDDEDIHTAVELRLTELVGPVAGKLATGRSRNDQVATDLRLYLLEETRRLDATTAELQRAVVEQAQLHLGVIMPGYTHTRQAQPLLFSHWLMSFFWKLERDRQRLADLRQRMSVLPLGAGALAGNPFGLDLQALATELGMRAADNSMDAVSDRDFAVEFLLWAALLQVHLSQLAEDLIVWGSEACGFVELHEAYCTGSSLMPQKKNPDALELMRGKTGRITGHLVGLLVVLKGLPSGYSRDLQEDKEAVFDAVDTLKTELPAAAGVVATLKVNADRMAAALDETLLATDLADYLVRKGIPFRRAHRLVGLAVRRAEDLRVSLGRMEQSEFSSISTDFGDDLYGVFDFERAVEARNVYGGTASQAVRAQIERARALLTGHGVQKEGDDGVSGVRSTA